MSSPRESCAGKAIVVPPGRPVLPGEPVHPNPKIPMGLPNCHYSRMAHIGLNCLCITIAEACNWKPWSKSSVAPPCWYRGSCRATQVVFAFQRIASILEPAIEGGHPVLTSSIGCPARRCQCKNDSAIRKPICVFSKNVTSRLALLVSSLDHVADGPDDPRSQRAHRRLRTVQKSVASASLRCCYDPRLRYLASSARISACRS